MGKPKKRQQLWFIDSHCILRYKQRVTDDVAAQKRRRTRKDIERIIINALQKVDLGQTEVINGAYFCPVHFKKEGLLYYILLDESRPKKALTIITEEMYQTYLNEYNWREDMKS